MPKTGLDEVWLAYARDYEAVEGARSAYQQRRNQIADEMMDRMKSTLGKRVLLTDAKDKQPYRELYLGGSYAAFRVNKGRSGKTNSQAGIGFTFDVWDAELGYGLTTYIFFRMGPGSFRVLSGQVQENVEKVDKRFVVEHDQGRLYVRAGFYSPNSDRFDAQAFIDAAAQLPGAFASLEEPVLALYKALKEGD
jgi:hypothetical protein